ncbi:MAG: SDR family oxidoreductase [Nevskiales bacterium]
MADAYSRAVITGAGSGLGRALALRFARAKWKIAVADINLAGAEETLAQVIAAGGSGFAQRCDVRSESDFTLLAERLKSEWGGVDVVVNNAGVAAAGGVAETSLADWAWMLDINLMGVVRGCHAFVPMLKAQNRGHVVNVAAFAAFASMPGMASYNVAKAGVLSLSETLRGELHGHGVGVTVACPAFFKTNLLDSFRSPDPAQKKLPALMMKASRVTADEVADAIYRAVRDNTFLVLSDTPSRNLYRAKRLSPELAFRWMMRVKAFAERKAGARMAS